MELANQWENKGTLGERNNLIIHSQTVLEFHYPVYHACLIQEPKWDPHSTKPVCEMH
jgi:hypothetical protein